MKTVYVSKSTLRLIKLFATGKRQGDVIEDAFEEIIKRGFDEPELLRYIEEDTRGVRVSKNAWYLVNRLKTDADYKRQDELIFDVMVNYCISKGLSLECVKSILNL